MRIVYEDEHLKVEHEQMGNFIVQTWMGFTTDEMFSMLLDKIKIFIEAKAVKGTIIDMRMHRGLSPKMQFHFTDVMEKHIKTVSSFRQAIMEPMDPFAKMTITTYLHELEKRETKTDTLYFDAFEEAKSWLEETNIIA